VFELLDKPSWCGLKNHNCR